MDIRPEIFLAFLFIFIRAAAFMLTMPLLGKNVPLIIRMAISGIIAVALLPVLLPHINLGAYDSYTLVIYMLYNVFLGALIGTCVHYLILAAQIAGSLLDIQMGISMAQVLSPTLGAPTSLLAQFHYLLASVLFFLINGHHYALRAFARSFELNPQFDLPFTSSLVTHLVEFVGYITLLSLQIAAPVLVVCVIVDLAIGIMNRTVPQMHAFILGIPPKFLLGMFTLALVLPAFVIVVRDGIDHTIQVVFRLLAMGKNS